MHQEVPRAPAAVAKLPSVQEDQIAALRAALERAGRAHEEAHRRLVEAGAARRGVERALNRALEAQGRAESGRPLEATP